MSLTRRIFLGGITAAAVAPLARCVPEVVPQEAAVRVGPMMVAKLNDQWLMQVGFEDSILERTAMLVGQQIALTQEMLMYDILCKGTQVHYVGQDA